MRVLKLGRWAGIVAVVVGVVSILGLSRAAAGTTCGGPVTGFTIGLAASSQKAGTPFTATVTAVNHCGATVTTYAGSGQLSSTLSKSPSPVSATPTATDVTGGATTASSILAPATVTIHFSGGRSLPSVTAYDAESSKTLTFSATGFNPVTTSAFTVAPADPNHVEFTQQPNVGGNSSWLLKTGNALTNFGVQVKIYDAYENITQDNGGAKVSLTLNQAAGLTGALSGGSQAPSSGVATFTNLTVDQTDIGYTLTASYENVTTARSAPFSVYLTTQACGGACTIHQFNVDNNTTAQVQGNGSFAFLGVANVDFQAAGLPEGCANYDKAFPSGSAPASVVVAETRTALGGVLDVTYGISKTLLQKLFGSNSGSQFIPICVGARRIALNNGQTVPVPCNQPYGTDTTPQTGWFGKNLDASGKFDGTLRQAICENDPNKPGYGYFWSIIGSFQDKTNSNPALEIDPGVNPTVTGWSSGGNYRFFTIEFPASSGLSGTAFANVPWDGWMG
jgi:hypothetical protein